MTGVLWHCETFASPVIKLTREMSRINTEWSPCYFITVYDLITELFTRRLNGHEFALGLITISVGYIFVFNFHQMRLPSSIDHDCGICLDGWHGKAGAMIKRTTKNNLTGKQYMYI